MRESLMYGSVRGARGNSRPYRDACISRVKFGSNRGYSGHCADAHFRCRAYLTTSSANATACPACRTPGTRARAFPSAQHREASRRLLDGGERVQAPAVNLALRPQVHVAVVRSRRHYITCHPGGANASAEALNARGIPTARGGRWAAMTVSNVLAWA